MSRKILSIVSGFALVGFGLSSCDTPTGQGAAAGAGAGAIIGGLAGGGPRSAVLGAAIGAASGALIGHAIQEDRARQLVNRVIELKPRGYLAILDHFQRLVKLEVERRTAKVESATPLPADLQASVQASLARIYGPGLALSFAQNPALLGGLRIKVGSDVYDGSIQARLAALEQSF